ncbi:hypothetical protein UPYG_G00331390 [Umbra pygmaea]|uniref:Ig-like domain-containing protein n=1 Tax=Umbra pygmaea TaxID=75934 RepID=A0ABD0VZL8_UMBPY
MSTWIYMLLFATFRETEALEVQTSQPIVLAIYRRPVVLACSFHPGTSSADNSLVVTWQRVEDSQVVHSFYYRIDQLDLQSEWYRNRTQLFHSKLLEGNASLRLNSVRPGDQGRYLCSISNKDGTGKAEVQVKYADFLVAICTAPENKSAYIMKPTESFYTEPRLTVQGCSFNVTFLYETEGYPEPEVQWLDSGGQILTHNLSVTESSRAPGLLSLRTQLVVQAGEQVNYTFSLRNQVLEQVIERPMSYVSTLPSRGDGDACPRCYLALLPILFIVGSLLGCLMYFCYSRKK